MECTSMHPEEAVKQVRYVIDASLDEEGNRTAPMYGQTFERVATEGTGQDVTVLADRIGRACRDGNRPLPAEANMLADEVLSQRTLTDGGKD